jgi:NAD(P)-dependent dehydrogenase (short-subunit alcohol dehydrogenase family)
MSNMEGKIVLVTGAKGGLGTFVSRKFLQTGATVVGSSRSVRASDIPHPRFVAMAADFSDGAVVHELVGQVVSRHKKIDALIHIVGDFIGGRSIAETDDNTWNKMRDLNLTAAFYAIRAVLPHMRRAKAGRIIAVGSLAASEPHAGLGAYVIFKRALETLVRTVAIENVDTNITANVVLPGTMDTLANRTAMPHADFSTWVQPDDVASVMVWLTGDEAARVNGAAIPVQ